MAWLWPCDCDIGFMKKKIKSNFKHTLVKNFSLQKLLTPFMLVLGLVFGFLADRVSGMFFGSRAAETEHSDSQMKSPSYKIIDPYEVTPAKPEMAKIVKAHAKPMAKAPVKKKHVAKAKPVKKKMQKVAKK